MLNFYEDAAAVPASVNDLILVVDPCSQGDVDDGQTAATDSIMLVVSRIVMEEGVRKLMVKQVVHSLDGAVNSFMLDGRSCIYVATTKGPSAEITAVAPTNEGELHLSDIIDNESGIIVNPSSNNVLDCLFDGECPMANTAHRACRDGMLVCACQDCLEPFPHLRTDKVPYMPCPVCVGRDIAKEARDFREFFVDSYGTDIGSLMDMIGRINQRRAAVGYGDPARFNDTDWGMDLGLSRAFNDDDDAEFEADFDGGDEPSLPLNPVSTATVNTLRTILTAEMLGEDKTTKCSICAEDSSIGSEVVALPCGHWFDSTCIESWFATSNTCPNCREIVTEVPVEVNRLEAAKKLEAEKNLLEAMKSSLESEKELQRTQKIRLNFFKSQLESYKNRREVEKNRLDIEHNVREFMANKIGVEVNRLEVEVNALQDEVNRRDAAANRLEAEVNTLGIAIQQKEAAHESADREIDFENEEELEEEEDEDRDLPDDYVDAVEEQDL